jgi:hypothetical protein
MGVFEQRSNIELLFFFRANYDPAKVMRWRLPEPQNAPGSDGKRPVVVW